MRRVPSSSLLRRSRRAWISSSSSTATAAATTSVRGSQASQQKPLSFFIETYGCQMNTSDSEVVRSILEKAGHYAADSLEDANIILVNTCAIRENAEAKIWHRLAFFNSLRRQHKGTNSQKAKPFPSAKFAAASAASSSVGVEVEAKPPPLVGVLGCMAERLKDRLLDEESVDFVCGPDAYRDMPRLVESLSSTGQKEANTRLSIDETYADIRPVRAAGDTNAFVSIMRGCNQMCSYCIVPFTRGRERSRDLSSILAEIRELHHSQGINEVCLLGQNVNGYHDVKAEGFTSSYKAAEGFSNLFNSKRRDIPGARFVDLLEAVSDISPELRIRFTSPHPKDFPDEVFQLIAERHNLCKSLHLPAQSGSSSVLERMRRGYDREAYMRLVERAREIIPGVSISTDLITGFSGESEEEHRDTLDLVERCAFDQAFMFAYSEREKTHASRSLPDDVPEETKLRRLQEIIDIYRKKLLAKNQAEETNSLRLVLVEGPSTRSTKEEPMLTGRTDANKRVVFPAYASGRLLSGLQHVPTLASLLRQGLGADDKKGARMKAAAALVDGFTAGLSPESLLPSGVSSLVGKYVLVHVAEANGPTLRAACVASCTNDDFNRNKSLLL